MAADSVARRLLKQALFPLLNQTSYRGLQSLAKAWDIRTGSWWEPELELVPLAVRGGETALDIGANYGLYAYHLSRGVGRSGRVYAFEPVPFTHATLCLVKWILRLHNVEVVPKGCSDRSGQVSFTLPIQSSGAISAGLAHLAARDNARPGKETHFQYDETREICCEVVALDEFLPELSNLSFIKSDIEGADLLALQGAERLIVKHHPTVVCEINPWFLEGFAIRLEDLVGFFTAHGYAMYGYEVVSSRGRLRQVTPPEVVEDNYVFIHPERRARFADRLW